MEPTHFHLGRLLLLCLPGVYLLGRRIAERESLAALGTRPLGAALGLALWLLASHFASLASGSFLIGAGASTVALGVAGTAVGWRPFMRREHRLGDPWLVGTALVGAALIAPAALFWAFHDELYITGHMSVAAQMLNGHYPPRQLAFPDHELRYHYFFPLLVALVSLVSGLKTPVAIDLATLGLWCLTWSLLWNLGTRFLQTEAPVLGSRLSRPGFLAAGLTLFGSGLPYFCDPRAPLEHNLLGVCTVEGNLVNPPMISFFFQHPWDLALPFGTAAIAIAFFAKGLDRALALPLLLAALAQSQIAFFFSVWASLLAVELWSKREPREGSRIGRWNPREVALATTPYVAALALAWLGRGMFAPRGNVEASEFSLKAGNGETLEGVFWWHLHTFGFLLPVGAYGISLLRGKRRLLLALLAGGSLLAVNGLDHYGDDAIQKFATVAAYALGLGAAAAIRAWLADGKRALALLAGAGSVSAGLVFPAVFALELPRIPRSVYHAEAIPLPPDDLRALKWLRREIPPGEVVYRNQSMAWAYAHWGGIAQVWIEDAARRWGFSKRLIADRVALLQRPSTSADDWTRQGIHWFAIDRDNPTDEPYRALLPGWIQAGRARVRAQFGAIEVVEVR